MLFQIILSIIHPEIRFDFLSGMTPPNNLQLGFPNEESSYIIYYISLLSKFSYCPTTLINGGVTVMSNCGKTDLFLLLMLKLKLKV